MRKGKVIGRVSIVLGLILLATAGGVYIQASRLPRAYQPMHLSPDERDRIRGVFGNRCTGFHNDVHQSKPCTWTFTQRQLNEYLASMDDIAAQMPGTVAHGQVDKLMEEAGLTEPALALRPGVITLMVQSTSLNKILSVDLGFEFSKSGTFRVNLLGTRIGRVPMPEALTAKALRQLKSAVRRRMQGSSAGRRNSQRDDMPLISVELIASALGTVIAAIDESEIPTELEIDGLPIRIEGIDVTDSAVSLRIQPLPGRPKPRTKPPATRQSEIPEDFIPR